MSLAHAFASLCSLSGDLHNRCNVTYLALLYIIVDKASIPHGRDTPMCDSPVIQDLDPNVGQKPNLDTIASTLEGVCDKSRTKKHGVG